MTGLNRRTFLTAGAASIVNTGWAKPATTPVIDTHIHLFDPTRPQGVPWPPKENKILYQPALPERYRKVVEGLGLVGAIEVECSPWPKDNEWVLGVAQRDTIIVGMVGDLEPGSPEFKKRLQQLHKNPLWLGIRYGNLWDRDLGASLAKPEFVGGLKELADAGLVLDTANPDLPLLASVVRVTDKVPAIRVVIDHLPQFEVPGTAGARAQYQERLKELSARPQVYFKVSEVLRRVGGRVPLDTGFYRARLDEFWQRFGEDRLLFGSDWPNSDLWAEYPQVLGLVRSYMADKGPDVQAKFFWKNSLAAYKWHPRNAAQRMLHR